MSITAYKTEGIENKEIPDAAMYRSVRDAKAGTLVLTDIYGRWEEILGVSADTSKADIKNVFKYIDPHDLKRLLDAIDESMESFLLEARYFHPHKKRDDEFWIQISAYRYSVGEIVYADGFILDITERKQRKAELETIDNMPGGAMFRTIREIETGIISFSHLTGSWEKILGVSIEDTIADAQKVFNNASPEGLLHLKQLINDWKEPTKNFEVEVRYYHPKIEDEYWLQVTSYPRREGDFIVANGFIIDITERKKKEIELEEYRNNLEQLVQIRTNELSAASERLQASNEELQASYEELIATNDELNRAQKQIEHQLIKLNLAVKASKVALWDAIVFPEDPLNPANTVIYSDEFRQFLGYKNEDDFPNTISSWSDKLHPEDKERSVKVLAAHLFDKTGKTPLDMEYRILTKTGEYRHIQAFGETIRDNNGQPLRVAGAIKDITDDKRILEELKQSNEEKAASNEELQASNEELVSSNEELNRAQKQIEHQLLKLDLAVKASNVALWDMFVLKDDPVNPVNKIIYSDEFRYILGYNDEEDFPNTLNSWSDKLHPEDKERSVNSFAAHMLDITGKTPFNIEYRLLTKTGEYRYIHAFGETIRDYFGQPLRVAGAIKDITDDKKMIEALHKSKNQLEASLGNNLFDSTLFRGVFEIAPERFYFEYVNTQWENITGLKPELVYENAYAFFGHIHPGDMQYLMNAITASKDNLTNLNIEFRFNKKGENCWLHITGHPYRRDENTIVCDGIIRNITKRKKNEVELIYAKEKAEESDKLKSAFLANMSHEIRTPLNAILGIFQLIDTEKLHPEYRDHIEIANTSSQQLLKVVSDILDISKIEAKQMTISNVEIDVNDLLRQLHSLYQKVIESKESKSNFELILEESNFVFPCIINNDDTRLRQVLSNLLDNAIKYTQKGFVSFGYRIDENDMLEFSIHDSGIGMAKHFVDVIFERFRQADLTTTREYGGTGLGLSISHELVILMGGSMWVESTENQGTSIYFTIPYS